MSKALGKTYIGIFATDARGTSARGQVFKMNTHEWWTTREDNGDCVVMHVACEGAEYHHCFFLTDRETCPTCDKKVPDCIILGSKIGAL